MAKFEFGVWEEAGTPRWLADYTSRDHLVPGGVKLDASQFPVEGTVTVTTPDGAAIGATSINVNALSGPIPNGTILDFTGAGEFVKLTSAAAQGATTLTVEALDAAIEAGDTATYIGTGKKYVPAGKVVGRTVAERNAEPPVGYGPAVATDDEIFILRFGVEDVSEDNDGVLVRPGAVIKENLLPEALDGTLAADVLAEIRSRYTTMRGVA